MDNKICVVGLGYVGLPLAHVFAKSGFEVIGFDVNKRRIEDLVAGHDHTDELSDEQLKEVQIEFTHSPTDIKKADFHVVAVPTPINEAKIPDLSMVISASEIVGENMQKGSTVVYESTVYPGCMLIKVWFCIAR